MDDSKNNTGSFKYNTDNTDSDGCSDGLSCTNSRKKGLWTV